LFAQDFLSQGQTPEDFSDEELTEMLAGSGVSKADLLRNYSQLLASPEEGDPFTLGTNQRRFDSEGNLIASGPTSSSSTGGGSSSTSSFTSTQKNKLAQAGLTDAPAQEQLDFLFGDNAITEAETGAIGDFLKANRNTDPETLRQELLTGGYSVSLVNSYLETRPMSDVDQNDMATALVSEVMDPKFFSSRGKELETAKKSAKESVIADFEAGALFDLFGERTKQLTQDEVDGITAAIDSFSGRETANDLIK
jgi:hypothetical protein